MNIRKAALLSLGTWGAIAFPSCTNDAISPLVSGEDGAGRHCPLSGVIFRLGSDDASASPEERPGWTRFEHDVWMDATEMTQAEYVDLSGGNPSPIKGDSLPVTNVSWYDAALAANARSKRDGLDTVYEYGSVEPDGSGNAQSLGALSIHLDRDGWRLPTEAEWEAAARAGTSTPWFWGALSDSDKAGSYAWFQGNSGARIRKVAGKSPNAWGLYDMAGNAMEWVNDWKGAFPADTVEEFAGQESPSDIPEVPLKGGAYNYGLSQLRSSNRTATYATYRSSRAEYVGFRLARGGFAARYTSSSGEVVYTPPVTLVRTDVSSLLGAWEARLVFVNRANGKGTLTWIDYGEARPVARSLPDSNPVFHPVISPDGQWVAWSTALEGSIGPSKIKARRLAKNDTVVLDLGEGAIPRWWTSGADTFLIRSEALDNTSPIWGGTKTLAQRWWNGGLTGAVETWAPSGSYHDGRSGSYLYTGYRRLRQYDMRSGTSRVLFTGSQNGKTSGDTSQVCNASVSPDGSGRALFLDFGYSGTSSVVGRSYGIHEIAFVSDSAGKVIGQISTPMGEAQWEHMEWSNASRWAVSGAIDGTGAYRNLYLVNVDSGSSTKIVSGEQLWQPALWVGRCAPAVIAGDADPDSSGAWNTPEASVAQSEFWLKTQKFWPLRSRIEIAAVGSSRLKDGIAPEEFHTGLAYNWGFDNAEGVANFTIIQNYLLPHAPKLKVVIASLMPEWFFGFHGEISWNTITQSIGYRYDLNHSFWRAGFPAGYLERVAARTASYSSRFDSLGGMKLPSGGWSETVPEYTFVSAEDFESQNFQANWTDLTELIDSCSSHKVHLILVNFPQAPEYTKTPSMGRWGPTWESWRELRRRIQSLEAVNPRFHFYDANADGQHDYTDAMAMNQDHLAFLGSQLLTRRLDTLIAGILGGAK